MVSLACWCLLVARDWAMVDFARRDTNRFFHESDFIVSAGQISNVENQFKTKGGQTTNGRCRTRQEFLGLIPKMAQIKIQVYGGQHVLK